MTKKYGMTGRKREKKKETILLEEFGDKKIGYKGIKGGSI